MKMKLIYTIAIFAFITLSLSNYTNAQDEKKDGKAIFTDAKCSACHGIQSMNIEGKRKDGKVPDLSSTGLKLKADFIQKYLKKEDKLNDKNHPIAFKGTDDELTTLSTWIESLKAEEKK